MLKNKDMCEVDVYDCMSFNEIYDLSLHCLKQYGFKELNDKSQASFDEFFNKIFSESWGIKKNTKKNQADKSPIINYATWKIKMKEAEIFVNRKGLRKGSSDYKEGFLQYFYPTIAEAYDHSITPSGSIKGKNKKDTLIVVPNPIRKQKSAISPDIFDMFPSIVETSKNLSSNAGDAEIKVNHVKSAMTSLVRYLAENVFNVKNLEFPEKGTNEELVLATIERYKQLIVFVMIVIGVENVLTVSGKQFTDLLERFLPVDEDGNYDWDMLQKTKSRHKFVKDVYDVIRKNKKDKDIPAILYKGDL